MVSKLSKQGILKGHVDAYCLVCESYFKSPMILDGHMLNPTHKSNLNAASYMEKYKDDYIRKVNKGYFCEFCNTLLPTAAKTGLHIEDPKHIARKGAMLLKRSGNKVVAFENIMIRDKAWNGLVDDTCFVCNSEFEDEEMHKRETLHKLNLVQCKTEFGTWGIIYRKIDNDSFHCLPCNKVYSMTAVTTHFNTNEHKEKCLKGSTKPAPTTNTENKISSDNKSLTPSKVPSNEPLKKRVIRRAANINISRPFVIRTITHEFENFVSAVLKANAYIVKKDYSKIWCIVCEWQMDILPSVQHVDEPHHKMMVRLHKTRLDRYTRGELRAEQQIIDAMDRFENNNVNIDVTVGTAVCQICFKSICYVYDLIDKHIKEHKQQDIEEKIVARKTNARKNFNRRIHNNVVEIKTDDSKTADDKKVEVKPAIINSTEIKAIENNTTNTDQLLIATEATKEDNVITRISRSQVKKVEKERKVSRSSSVTSINDPETIEWAAENKITFDLINKISFCNICNAKLPMWLKNVKEHVAGNTHKKLLTKYINNELAKPKKPKNYKVATKIYIKSFILVENLFSQHFIINNKLVINYHSMCFLRKTHGDFLKCFLCNIDVVDTPYTVEVHRTLKRHSEAQQDALVITSLDSEFVRETEYSEYHCGFCNHLEKNWADLTKHLTTTEHKESRTAADWRLQEFLAKF